MKHIKPVIFVFVKLFLFISYTQVFQVRDQRSKYAQLFRPVYQHISVKFENQDYNQKMQVRGGKSIPQQLEEYCLERDLNTFFHPDTIMSDTYLYNDAKDYTDKIQYVYKNGFPYFHPKEFKYTLSDASTIIQKWQGLKYTPWVNAKSFNVHSCIFEKRMRIPLKKFTFMKSIMNIQQNKLIQKLQRHNASQECLKVAQITTKGYTYVFNFKMTNKADCLEIVKIIINNSYTSEQIPIKYLVKNDIHEAQGVNFLNETYAQKILKDFDNGKKCGHHIWQNTQIQEYIHNPLLLDGYVFVFRAYLLIPSIKPLIVYLYDKTSLQVALFKWNNKTFSKRSHFCNNRFVKDYLKEQKIDLESEEGIICFFIIIRKAQKLLRSKDLMWSYEELTAHLSSQGNLNVGVSVYDLIYSKIEQKIGLYFKDIAQVTSDSRFGQNSAIDFMFDADLNLHQLEFNNYYNQEERYEERSQFLRKIHDSNINLTFMYMRNRFERLRVFIQTEMANLTNRKKHKGQKQLNKELDIALTDSVIENGKTIDNFVYLDLVKGRSICSKYL